MLTTRNQALTSIVRPKLYQMERALRVPKASGAIGKRPNQRIQQISLTQARVRSVRSSSSMPREVTMGRPEGTLMPQAMQTLAVAGSCCWQQGQVGPGPV